MCVNDSQSRIVAVRVSGSPLQSQYTTVFQHITIHRQQKCWITGSQKIGSITPCSNKAYGQTYLNIFLAFICLSIYPGLRLSSSKANSQGHASGRSLNQGTSIMVPTSAPLTLTPAQELEDNKSQEQAAKAEKILFESTGNKIY